VILDHLPREFLACGEERFIGRVIREPSEKGLVGGSLLEGPCPIGESSLGRLDPVALIMSSSCSGSSDARVVTCKWGLHLGSLI
jgi:hypothetical protein